MYNYKIKYILDFFGQMVRRTLKILQQMLQDF